MKKRKQAKPKAKTRRQRPPATAKLTLVKRKFSQGEISPVTPRAGKVSSSDHSIIPPPEDPRATAAPAPKPPKVKTRLQLMREKQRRAKVMLGRPYALEQIFEHVANGGSLISLCDEWRILHSSAILWIYCDPQRKERYELAQKARGEWWVQRVLQELETVGMTDIREAFDQAGRMKDIQEMPEAVARAISSIEVEELFDGQGEEREHVGQVKKVKLWDKIRAQELIGKKLKMFIDRAEVTVTGSLASDIQKGRQRAAAAAAAVAASLPSPAAPPAAQESPVDEEFEDERDQEGDA